MSAPRLNFPYGSGGGGGGGVSGTGTPPALAMWATSSSLTDSPLSFASQTLTISPSVRFFTFGHHQQWTLPNNAFALEIQGTSGNATLKLDTNIRYVGVDSPSSPADKLHLAESGALALRMQNTVSGTYWQHKVDASGNWGLAVNGGANAVTALASNGFVGIGTTSPASALHVRNNTAGITLDSTLGGGRQYQLNPLRTGLSNSGFEIRDVTASAAVISFDALQNVAIGTATPATANSRLTVAGGFIVPAAGFGVYQVGDHLTLQAGAGKNVHLRPNDGGVLAVNVGSATCDMSAVAGYVLAVGGPVRATGTLATAPAFSTPTDTNTGMYFPAADTVRIAAGANIGMEVDPNGVFGINNGFGSIAPAYGCRAWVNFDSTVSGTWAGGASTVTRVAGSTTATITTTNNHGLITGNTVYALTGVAAGTYTVTYVGVKTFTITTVATTALSAVAITFAVNNIRASGGVSSVTDISTGIFSVNFSTAMPDVNYSAVGTKQNVATNSAVSLYDCFTAVGAAPGRTTTQCGWQCIENAAAADSNNVNIAVFR